MVPQVDLVRVKVVKLVDTDQLRVWGACWDSIGLARGSGVAS